MSVLEEKIIELGDGLFLDVKPESEYLQVRIGQEKKLIKKVDLWAAVFAIADPDTQEKLTPVRQTQMVTYARVHTIQIKKDMHKGELLRCKCRINVPQVIEEGLAGNLKKTIKGGLVLPKKIY